MVANAHTWVVDLLTPVSLSPTTPFSLQLARPPISNFQVGAIAVGAVSHLAPQSSPCASVREGPAVRGKDIFPVARRKKSNLYVPCATLGRRRFW